MKNAVHEENFSNVFPPSSPLRKRGAGEGRGRGGGRGEEKRTNEFIIERGSH